MRLFFLSSTDAMSQSRAGALDAVDLLGTKIELAQFRNHGAGQADIPSIAGGSEYAGSFRQDLHDVAKRLGGQSGNTVFESVLTDSASTVMGANRAK